MTNKAVYPKVAADMYALQMLWTGIFLAILFILHLLKIAAAIVKGTSPELFTASTFVAANIYLLVIGILVGLSIPGLYVWQGVTRKDYFLGNTIASVGISFTVPVIVHLISVIERFILKILPFAVEFKSPFGKSMFDPDDANIIGDTIQMAILSPYVDPSAHLIAGILVFGLSLLFAYLVGWLIGSGFSRFSGMIGLLYIVVGIGITICYDILTGLLLAQPLPGSFNSLHALDIPQAVTGFGILALLVISLVLIRLTTKRLVIKP